MEVLVILFFIVILVFILSLRKNIGERITNLEVELRRLREELAKRPLEKKAIEDKPVEQPLEKPTPPVSPTTPPVIPPPASKPYGESGFKKQEEEGKEEQPLAEAPEALLHETKKEEVLRESFAKQSRKELIAEKVAAPPPPPTPGFFERHPDLEKFIGENLVSKIGIAILVLAIGFFVKYAIDNNWIGPVGRVGIGILCGGVLVGIAHRMRKNYQAFSSVLVGGGLAVFFFTIALAYHQYHLFGQTTAFIIMVVITAFAVVLSLLYNRQELAIIALVGAFVTPFLVSDGSGNYKTLFIYLIVINSGLLIIAYNKAWRLLNILAFIFTVILFGSWLFMLPYNEPAITYRNGLLFATIFYAIYFAVNVAHNIRERKKFIASDFSIILANTALYFAAGLFCLSHMEATQYNGLFSASLGVCNLLLSYFFFRKEKVDKNVLYLLVGITLTFISLTAPIQLKGNYITLFWATEAVLLFRLSQKASMRIIRYGSLIVFAAMLVSASIDLLTDWVWIAAFSDPNAMALVNKRFTMIIVAAASAYALHLLRERELKQISNFKLPSPPAVFFRVVSLLLLYFAGLLEVEYKFFYYHELLAQCIVTYTLAFILLLTSLPALFRKALPATVSMALLGLAAFIYLGMLPATFKFQQSILLEKPDIAMPFVAHWVSALLVFFLLFKAVQTTRGNAGRLGSFVDILTWLTCSFSVIFFSAELHLICNNIFYSKAEPLENIKRVVIKAGFPILWGVCSFVFMWLGMKFKFRTLRIISLTLFLITLLKLFIYDIQNIPVAGKIAAFFCLGVLLLVVSFMYQRLKKIIIDEEKTVA